MFVNMDILSHKHIICTKFADCIRKNSQYSQVDYYTTQTGQLIVDGGSVFQGHILIDRSGRNFKTSNK